MTVDFEIHDKQMSCWKKFCYFYKCGHAKKVLEVVANVSKTDVHISYHVCTRYLPCHALTMCAHLL